ncbi:MAG TPA: hypothetical protein DEQ47_11130 [Solibacterales bacterium]|nr:hypothetical protein [Bryobacterales bacterium]
MPLAFRSLLTSFAAARQAAKDLCVPVAAGVESNALPAIMRSYADNVARCLEPAAAAFEALEARPLDASAMRAALSACHEALECSEAPCQDLAGAMREALLRGACVAPALRIEAAANDLTARIRTARHELRVAWSKFTEPSSSAAERPPEDLFLDTIQARTFEWYKQADAKAQAILAFTGVFLAILLGSVVLKAETEIWKAGSPWLNLLGIGVVLALYLAGAFLCVLALWSRGMRDSRPGIYFFGNIANLPVDGLAYVENIRQSLANRTEDHRVRAEQVLRLSRNTRRKHRLVNAAVLCSSSALLGTAVMGMVLVRH